MNRRNFLRGCLAVTALAIVQVPDLHAYPILYSDGVHDDTDAVQAIMDLKPFVVEGKLIEGYQNCVLRKANLNISRSILVKNSNTVIEGCRIKYTGASGSFCFDVYGDDVWVSDNVFTHMNDSGPIRGASSVRGVFFGGNIIQSADFDMKRFHFSVVALLKQGKRE